MSKKLLLSRQVETKQFLLDMENARGESQIQPLSGEQIHLEQ